MSGDAPTWFANEPTSTTSTSAGGGEDRGVTYLEAIRYALEDELAADDRVVLLGEDIGHMGGAFRVTEGLFDRFGPSRVLDTPMAEIALVGAGIGLAIADMRPIVELQFADFISCAYDQLVTEAAKLHYRFGIAVPMVVRAPAGGDVGAGPFHSQSPEGIFAHVPGLKVVCPGDVQDAYDLLRASVADPNPVLYFEHKALYRSLRGMLERRVPTEPLGRAAVRRAGDDVTLVTYGAMLPRCLEAADAMAAEGIEVEVLDLRTVFPADHGAVAASVERTGRLVVVHEDTRSSGIGAEIAARVAEERFFALDAPIGRVTAPDTPIPFARPLEEAHVPSVQRIADVVRADGGGMTEPFSLEVAYGWMSLSRTMEARLRSAYTQGRLRGRLLSGRGQEAIPAGATLAVDEDDHLAPVHRDLATHLIRGTTPVTIFRHYLGRATGPSQGRDGDLHMGEWSRRIFPMVSHLPDSWPVLAGVALASKLRGEPHVAMAFCGDGATSTGTWHETVNFAAVQQLPMVLVVEDNQYAYSTPTSAQYRCSRIVDRACGYGIPGFEVDGNDVEAVHEVVASAVGTARAGGGPTLVVARTLRMDGHAFHDAAAYVPDPLKQEWSERDPLVLAAARLRVDGWDDARFDALHAEQTASVKAAWEQAELDPLPDGADLERGVYAEA